MQSTLGCPQGSPRRRTPIAGQFISLSSERQRRLNRSRTSCPEMILANDTLVGGGFAAEPLLATTVVGSDGACLATTSFTCLFLTFDFRFSAPVTVEGAIDAYDCTSGAGSSGSASTAHVGGTIVGRFVSITIRSGCCCMEAIRMIGLLTSSPVGSDMDFGRNQFATSSNTSSDVPTQAMYRPIGMTVLAIEPDDSKCPNP